MSEAKLERGKKWKRVREIAVFENRQMDVDWLDSQASIVDDIKFYEDSLKPVKETKSKKEK